MIPIKDSVILFVVILALVVGIAIGILVSSPKGSDLLYTGDDGGVACTQEAMMCPDGSYVGRSGPRCEFVCPGE